MPDAIKVNTKRFILACWLCIGACSPIVAQFSISGRVLSASDGTPVEMATVQLFRDSTFIRGAQTDSEGNYHLTPIPNGRYLVGISSVGYQEHRQIVNIKNADVTLPSVRLKEQVQALAEVQVQGRAAEMTVKGDTIEYNTAAYKVGENAMVEDLLKKMNGVTVDKEGNVTVNGESITAVRIDGKKFFGNDVQSATKNIPADMIEKVQVIDEKSEMAKLTGFDDDEGSILSILRSKRTNNEACLANIPVQLVLIWSLPMVNGSITPIRLTEQRLPPVQNISSRTTSATTPTSSPISC